MNYRIRIRSLQETSFGFGSGSDLFFGFVTALVDTVMLDNVNHSQSNMSCPVLWLI